MTNRSPEDLTTDWLKMMKGEMLPTGIASLDRFAGGFPRGCLVIAYGSPGTENEDLSKLGHTFGIGTLEKKEVSKDPAIFIQGPAHDSGKRLDVAAVRKSVHSRVESAMASEFEYRPFGLIVVQGGLTDGNPLGDPSDTRSWLARYEAVYRKLKQLARELNAVVVVLPDPRFDANGDARAEHLNAMHLHADMVLRLDPPVVDASSNLWWLEIEKSRYSRKGGITLRQDPGNVCLSDAVPAQPAPASGALTPGADNAMH